MIEASTDEHGPTFTSLCVKRGPKVTRLQRLEARSLRGDAPDRTTLRDWATSPPCQDSSNNVAREWDGVPLRPFRVQPLERRLLRDDAHVALTPKAFDLLLVLIENSGHLLEKDQLMKRVWPDAFVEAANLANNISLLRRVLSAVDGLAPGRS
jgi:DNA-binding response OmpR family regulator